MTEIKMLLRGKYELLKEIGRGGMSVVYLAVEHPSEKQWAVKEISKSGDEKRDEVIIKSILAEVELMQRLHHPSLPRMTELIDCGSRIYLVMDYIEGESLDKYLEANGPQKEECVIDWGKQLCEVLMFLHSQTPSVIYRDMKPANIMLQPDGKVKIIDFGIARQYKECNVTDTETLGTKGYAPPEQYKGQTDQRSDIYALGMTMHQLLTGVDPKSQQPYKPIRQWDRSLSEWMERVIERCTEPIPEKRYQSCAELLYDLENSERFSVKLKNQQKRDFLIMHFKGFLCRKPAKSQKGSRDGLYSGITKMLQPFSRNRLMIKEEIMIIHTEEEIESEE